MSPLKTAFLALGIVTSAGIALAQEAHFSKDKAFPTFFEPATPSGSTLLIRSGNWSAFKVSGSKGNICAVRSTWAGRGFGFVTTSIDPTKLTIFFAKRAWSFSEEDQAVINYQFGETAVSKIVGQDINSDALMFNLSPAQIPAFLYKMATEDFLYVKFNIENESVWTVDLAGTGLAMTAFTTCMTN